MLNNPLLVGGFFTYPSKKIYASQIGFIFFESLGGKINIWNHRLDDLLVTQLKLNIDPEKIMVGKWETTFLFMLVLGRVYVALKQWIANVVTCSTTRRLIFAFWHGEGWLTASHPITRGKGSQRGVTTHVSRNSFVIFSDKFKFHMS